MKVFKAFLSNSIFALNVLLLVLFLFRDKLVVPVWVQPFGRMHPMVLHLPIGILLLAILMVIFQSGFKKKSFHNFLNFALYLAAFTAAVTAIMGMLLSAEGGYGEVQLNRHILSGVAVSFLAWALLAICLYAPERKTVFNVLLGANILVILLAGHFGSVLTHGENFVFAPLMQEEKTALVITDSTSLYAAAIVPVFESKCFSCHNEKKAKGELIMTRADKIVEGGEHGPVWVAGDPANSTLIKRIHLPEANDDHMPPSGKPQLTRAEIKLLFHWILNGADLQKPWTRYTPGDSMRLLADAFIQMETKPKATHYPFSFVAAEDLAALNTPYCTVGQLALDEPALKADFFLAQGFDGKKLEALLPVKEQLVILNISGMPLTAADGKTIAQFTHLENLLLNKTRLTPELLSAVAGLKNLKSVSLSSTNTDRSMAEKLTGASALKEVFLWNSAVTYDDVAALNKQYPAIHWDAGYHTDEILRLTAPLLANDGMLLKEHEPIRLRHSMPGTQIRYTLDGTTPDSVKSSLYEKPIPITGYTQLKAKAFKPGWYGSAEVEMFFFQQGIKPLGARLVYPPNSSYKGEGVASLTDSKKGSTDNFREVMWLGFREKPLVALFQMDPSTPIEHVTVSYGKISTSFILPPASAEIWGGNDPEHLKLLQRIVPVQPQKSEPGHLEALIFSFPQAAFPVYKLIANPVPQVPVWVSKKPEKGWLFVDEVIFN